MLRKGKIMILRTYETRHCSSYEEATSFIKELERVTEWKKTEKSGIKAGEVVDCPILPDMYEKAPVPVVTTAEKNGVLYPTLEGGETFRLSKKDKEAMGEAMGESKMVVGFKESAPYSEYKAHPLALNALGSLAAAAGYQRSPALCNTEDKMSQDAMRPELRAAIINEGLRLMKGTCQIYTCDQMVRFVASKTYVPLAISDLLGTLKGKIDKAFPKAEFMGGYINHCYVDFSWRLNDDILTKKINNILDQAGINAGYEPVLRFITSNTGDSGVNLYPIMLKKNTWVAIETPVKMEHTGDASIEKFGANVEKAYAMFKTLPNRLESLGQVPVSNTENAFLNMGAVAGLPPKSYSDSAELFAATYGNMATALDIYFALSEALGEYADKNNLNSLKRSQFESNLARVFVDQQKILDCDTKVLLKAS